jgi:dipeptidyl aminopeptidase/acylaminoacyl peptidase
MTASVANHLPHSIGGQPNLAVDRSSDGRSARQQILKAFPVQRLVGYGMDLGDASLLRSLVEDGADWREASMAVSEQAHALIRFPVSAVSPVTRRQSLRRASAALRISQVMDESDTDSRREIYRRATDLFEMSIEDDERYSRVWVPHPLGDLAGWLVRPDKPGDHGTVVIFGGLEGWADACHGPAQALVERGLAALILDGPGQGVTRMANRHYLGEEFVGAYKAAVSYVLEHQRHPMPVGIWGNSEGGTIAMHIAANDDRIQACCNNGGGPTLRRRLAQDPSAYRKMKAMCGADDEACWRIVDSLGLDNAQPSMKCPVLIVHGNKDVKVEDDDMLRLVDSVDSPAKKFLMFEDGHHCIHNHQAQLHALVSDWFAETLFR